MQYDTKQYAYSIDPEPVRVIRELAKNQPDMILVENGVWECNSPTFRVAYIVKKVDNDVGEVRVPLLSIIAKMVSTRQVQIDIDTQIEIIKTEAQAENKDIVFYKYRKWEPINDFDTVNFTKHDWTPMRYCLIDKEFGEVV